MYKTIWSAKALQQPMHRSALRSINEKILSLLQVTEHKACKLIRAKKLHDAVAWRRLRVLSLDLRETLPFVFSLFSHPLESCRFGDGFFVIIDKRDGDYSEVN
ncbi:hypothetical protein COI83_30325 [Bacillus cereus]|nr:hypothetical protein COI83_30325 [Bacillus cereus]